MSLCLEYRIISFLKRENLRLSFFVFLSLLFYLSRVITRSLSYIFHQIEVQRLWTENKSKYK